jgi:hypothetical protein
LRPNVDTIKNIINWKSQILDNLTENNYDYDIILITYESSILNNITNELKPKKVLIYPFENGNEGQLHNFEKVNDFMLSNKNNYNRFLILRFDIVYKIPICRWNNWNKNGIILPSKDISWLNSKLYNDIVFIVDTESIEIFDNAVKYMLNVNNISLHDRLSTNVVMPHHIGQYLYLNNYNIILIYDKVLCGVNNHPLYALSRLIR